MSTLDPLEPSDEDLVARARTGSAPAMEQLYRRYRDRIMAFAWRMTGDRTLAEDIFQGTFIYFYENLGRYDARGKLAAYLFQIARNQALDALRAGRRRKRLLSRVEPAEPPLPEESRADQAEKALLDLPAHLREVVTLKLYEGLDYAKIAEITGVPEATARSRMRYALEALREALHPRKSP
jgi:RNA polymerase sigma-70 factor (ECF subfamily)